MNIQTELYSESIKQLPDRGKYIIGQQTADDIVVYQAYKPSIANYAVSNQTLGGGNFSYDRMSWIKPGFLWMMYRCGWAIKEDQERVLALWISKKHFLQILSEAVPSKFKPEQFASSDEWKEALKTKDVRLQWDPDHDPYGRKQNRRAIQLGLKGPTLSAFGTQFISKIEDITEFVVEQKQLLDRYGIESVKVPVETIMEINNPGLKHKLSLLEDDENTI
jgi:hypothetical protein